MSEYYEYPDNDGGSRPQLTLPELWRLHRDEIEQDLHSTYGLDVDLAEPDRSPILKTRSWRWLLVRIYGLFGDPRSRLVAAYTRPPTPDGR